MGVFGAVMILGRSPMLAVGLFGLASLVLSGFTLPLLSLPNNAPIPFPFVSESADTRSGLFGGLEFFFLEKTSLIFAPGETPRLLLPSATPRDRPSLVSMVEAC